MDSIDFSVLSRVFEFQVSLLHKGGDLLELVVGISGVVHYHSVEHLGEMAVEILLNISSGGLGFFQLGLDAIKGFLVDTHNYFV